MSDPGLTVSDAPAPRGRLFRKYAALFIALVGAALLVSGAIEIWFVYRDQRELLERFQNAQAAAMADRIGLSVREIENQMAWTVQLPWLAETLPQRRLDAQRLLRQVPTITVLTQLDGAGREQLRVSPLAIDVVGSNRDLAQDPAFLQAATNRPYFSPVFFRLQSEPYMTIGVAGARRDVGISIVDVNLKFVWDMVAQTRSADGGTVYVVDAAGRLIAHADPSLPLRNISFADLPQVRAAIAGDRRQSPEARDPDGGAVISAHAAVPRLGWFVFVDLPLREALDPIYESLLRTAVLLLLGLAIAALAGLALARQMTTPIRVLRDGAAQIGHGDLSRRIAISTGDELETLAQEFNAMAARLQDSYADLEQKIEKRTRDLARTADELQQKNKELEAFSYSVSHDLRAPLRGIDGFSQALIEDYSDKLDERGRDRLRRIRAAAQRMSEIIDDLLQLAHVSRAEIVRAKIDLTEIAAGVIDELQRRDPSRRVEFIAGGKAIADADSRLLRVVFDNLLGNAWKFTSKTDAARIEFGVTRHNGSGDAFMVRDNGAGFDMEFAAKLFRPFQRLHSAAEFPGTGIGLATVARVIDRHGGRVWAEGAPGKGAAVYFTLPSAQPDL